MDLTWQLRRDVTAATVNVTDAQLRRPAVEVSLALTILTHLLTIFILSISHSIHQSNNNLPFW